MLEHTGRRAARGGASCEVLACGPGRVRHHRRRPGKAQWYRNITANPRVRVSTGFRRNWPRWPNPCRRPNPPRRCAPSPSTTRWSGRRCKGSSSTSPAARSTPCRWCGCVQPQTLTPANGGLAPRPTRTAAKPHRHAPYRPFLARERASCASRGGPFPGRLRGAALPRIRSSRVSVVSTALPQGCFLCGMVSACRDALAGRAAGSGARAGLRDSPQPGTEQLLGVAKIAVAGVDGTWRADPDRDGTGRAAFRPRCHISGGS